MRGCIIFQAPMHCEKRYAVAMPDAADLREALADQLDAVPADRWSGFLVALCVLFRRHEGAGCRRPVQYDERVAFTRSFHELIADARRTRH